MTESRFVLDTNAIIFLTTRNNAAAAELKDKLKVADLFISVISDKELLRLNWPGLKTQNIL
jgi:predicted nucleic acid-binding protein